VDEGEAELNGASIEELVVVEVHSFSRQDLTLESRGRGGGRGRGEARGRGRGGASGTSDATSTAATIGSDETPSAWPEFTSTDDTIAADKDSHDVNGINGTKYDEPPAPSTASVLGVGEVKPVPAATSASPAVNGSPAKKAPTTAPTSKGSRIVDPSATFSWASIVKPAAPPPVPKPVAQSKATPQPPEPTVPHQSSRPSTRGQDITEEPAQTIHDPFTSTATEPSKPKVQLPQPALPYIPTILTQQQIKQPELAVVAQLPPTEPLTSRNLDLLEDQQPPTSQAAQPPTPSVTAHRTSPVPKEGPPGPSARFARNSRDQPVIMPGVASPTAVGGMQLQFGYYVLD
jgi:hypothetical protein